MNAVVQLSPLQALPVKVRRPLEQLLALGHLDRAVLDDLLVAGELAGDTSRLLGFAVSYLSLQQQGVPMRDVLAMAREQRRRINLSWSAARWRTEHDRWSRAAALIQLASDGTRYDVSQYEVRLPTKFAGYLIRSSRRLGMEGLRQRHCVASYHQKLSAGYCAIAVVFVNKQRWTVQLACGLEGQVRISQVRSRLNVMPSTDVQERIREILQLPRPASETTALPNRERNYMNNLRRILPILRNLGVTEVHVSFDGSGDEGSIDNTVVEGGSIDNVTATVESDVPECLDGVWRSKRALVEEQLETVIHQITYDYLDEAGVNWHDGDGGFGELVLDVIEGTVRLEVNVRYTERSCEYDRMVDIATGEAIEA